MWLQQLLAGNLQLCENSTLSMVSTGGKVQGPLRAGTPTPSYQTHTNVVLRHDFTKRENGWETARVCLTPKSIPKNGIIKHPVTN